MSHVAIILINYNSTKLTRDCVQSLRKYQAPNDEYHILVWDNQSRPAPQPEDLLGADLQLSSENLGFAAGYNAAVDLAMRRYHPEYLLILNNDTRVTDGMIVRLIKTFNSNPAIGAVVPKIYFERGCEFHKADYTKDQRGKVIWYAGGGIDWPNMILFHLGIDEVDRGQFERPSETQFAAGTAILTTPKIWRQVGGFDPAYFLYYEDADFSLRLRRRGKQIMYEPRATLFHINAGSTSGSGSAVHQYYQTRNRLRFGLQYSQWRTKLALLKEAKRLWQQGTAAQRQGVLHALEGKWGKQTIL